MFKWPLIIWSTYNYLIKQSSVSTAYRSLDIYNYVLCGYMQEINFYDMGSEFCSVSAAVLSLLRLSLP